MRVLLLGGTGFLGRHLSFALAQAGHEVVCASRRPPAAGAEEAGGAGAGQPRHVQVDFAAMLRAEAWAGLLRGFDAVVNAVGILREGRGQAFQELHVQAPIALFDACVAQGVRRVVQVSALGADEAAASAYHLSKRAADEHLLGLPLQATVVQPSLVFGSGGTSASLFGTWAALPLLPLPGGGGQRVQPIHVDDAVAAIVNLLGRPDTFGRRIVLVGPVPLTLREFLQALRGALGMRPAWVLPIPMPLMRLGAWLAGWLPTGLLDRDSLAMLERGNTADAIDTTRLLGRTPRPVARFLAGDAAAAKAQALLGWVLPLVRWSIAAVWIVTGVLSLGVFPVDQSLALLGRLGLHGGWASLMLYGAAGLDLALGLATLVWHRRRLWVLQGGLILLYTVLISLYLPEFWLHPFGPILKNVPMLAAIWMLWAFEKER